jgi:hypothetical protein
MPGAQKLRREAHFKVRGNDEVEAQRRRWAFYETINIFIITNRQVINNLGQVKGLGVPLDQTRYPF